MEATPTLEVNHIETVLATPRDVRKILENFDRLELFKQIDDWRWVRMEGRFPFRGWFYKYMCFQKKGRRYEIAFAERLYPDRGQRAH